MPRIIHPGKIDYESNSHIIAIPRLRHPPRPFAPPTPKALWDANCAQCHGKDGHADTKMGKHIEREGSDRSESSICFTDAKATQSIKEGVKENGKTTMKAFGGKLTDDEIKALVAYTRTLKK